MTRITAYLCSIALAVTFLVSCGGSSGTGGAKLYSIREPDALPLTASVVSFAMNGEEDKLGTIDTDSLTEVGYENFLFKSTGSAYDSASQRLLVPATIYGGSGQRSLLLKVRASTGAATKFYTNDTYEFAQVLISGTNIFVFSLEFGSSDMVILKISATSGELLDTITVTLPDSTIADPMGDNFVMDGATGDFYALLYIAEGGPAIFHIDGETGVADVVAYLSNLFDYCGLYLSGSNVNFVRDDRNNSIDLVSVPKAGGEVTTEKAILAEDSLIGGYTRVLTGTYVHAVSSDGKRLFMLFQHLPKDSDDGVDVLARIDTTTGEVTVLDDVEGCYYGCLYFP